MRHIMRHYVYVPHVYVPLIAAGFIAAAAPALAQARLTDDQRREAYGSIIRQRTPEPHRPPGFNIILGSELPSSVYLNRFPPTVTDPAIRRYGYVAVNNMVVLIDLETRRMVEVLR